MKASSTGQAMARYAGPEDLPLRERCLIAQSDGGGPVMLNGLYNNNYEFHLTSDIS